MKTIKHNSKHCILLTVASFLILGVSQSLFATSTIPQTSCKSCHGQQYEKAALGKSKVLRDITKEEIQKALIGYKNKTYGGQLKGVMEGQVSKYSEKELKSFELELKK
jgi:cytochrome c-type protein NapB